MSDLQALIDRAAAGESIPGLTCDWCERTDVGSGKYATACPSHEADAGRIAAEGARLGGADSGARADAEVAAIRRDRELRRQVNRRNTR